ncbi:MAG: fibronectin type III domain-containing protein [Eubacterium sp.]|nr:fibronectin type III domain-containing protein [Eubacterium sp.]
MVKRFKRFLAMVCTAALFVGSINIPVEAASATEKEEYTGFPTSQTADVKKYGGTVKNGIVCYDIDKVIDEPEAPTYEAFVKGVKKEEQTDVVSSSKGLYKDIIKNRDWYSYGSKYIYNQLDTNEKKLYRKMYSYCLYLLTNANSNNKIATNYKLVTMELNGKKKKDYVSPAFDFGKLGISRKRAFELYIIFTYENPQFYFIDQVVYYRSASSFSITFYEKFKDSVSRAKVTNSIFDVVDKYAQQVIKMPNDEQKARKAEELIMTRNSYCFARKIPGKSFTEDYDQTIYSTFKLGYTVCAGYCKGVLAVLAKAGMGCIAVTSSNHAWNLVKVNGKWYNLDATWDDSDSGVFDRANFLKSDGYMTANDISDAWGNPAHQRDNEWSNAPSCLVNYGQAWPAAYANINKKVDSAESKLAAIKTNLSNVYTPTLLKTTIKVKLSKSTYLYNGKARKPSVKVTMNGKVLSPVEYTVKYANGRTNPGVYKVKVTLKSLTGYKASKTVKFAVIPKRNDLTSVKNVADGVSVKWTKGTGNISGYEVQVSPVKNFSKGVKSKKIGKVAKVSTTLKNLESGKKYYFRIRTYKANASGVAYSNWSPVRSIKVK